MKTYFIFSDVHSFYSILKDNLEKNNFEYDNKDHILISCGDLFDRGYEAKELLDFLIKFKAEYPDRLILVKGNHEDLLEDCYNQIVNEQEISYHHWTNGTVDTICQLTNISRYNLLNFCYDPEIIKNKLRPYFNLIESCVNYYKLDNKIFVHGWIPNTDISTWEDADWKSARWDCGYDEYLKGKYIKNCKIFCGHWHSSYAWSKVKGISQFGDDAIYDIYENGDIVCLDASTIRSEKINIYKLVKA